MAADDSAERDFSVSGQSGVVPFQAHPERRFVFPDRMPPRRLFVSGFGAGDCALLLAAAGCMGPELPNGLCTGGDGACGMGKWAVSRVG